MNVKPCPHCGQDVRDEYERCPFCGANVETGERRASDPNDRIAVSNGAIFGACLMLSSYFFLRRGIFRFPQHGL